MMNENITKIEIMIMRLDISTKIASQDHLFKKGILSTKSHFSGMRTAHFSQCWLVVNGTLSRNKISSIHLH